MLQSEITLKTMKSNIKYHLDLNEKERKKRVKIEWKNLSEGEKLKWASRKKQKKEIAANKLKFKVVQK